MNVERISGWLQIVANLGILGGLILVGFQLQQNGEISVGFLLFAAFSGDPYRLLAVICYMTLITVTAIVWLKFFRKV
jgi:hypothetical protein